MFSRMLRLLAGIALIVTLAGCKPGQGVAPSTVTPDANHNPEVSIPATPTIKASHTPAPTATPTLTQTPTSTPTPTVTPTPTATPLPQAVVGDTPLSLRAGPGLLYPLVAIAQPGSTLSVYGMHATRPWLKVKVAAPAGDSAWAPASQLMTTDMHIQALTEDEALPPPPAIIPKWRGEVVEKVCGNVSLDYIGPDESGKPTKKQITDMVSDLLDDLNVAVSWSKTSCEVSLDIEIKIKMSKAKYYYKGTDILAGECYSGVTVNGKFTLSADPNTKLTTAEDVTTPISGSLSTCDTISDYQQELAQVLVDGLRGIWGERVLISGMLNEDEYIPIHARAKLIFLSPSTKNLEPYLIQAMRSNHEDRITLWRGFVELTGKDFGEDEFLMRRWAASEQIKALEQEDERAKEMAANHLSMITAQELGFDLAAWQAWLDEHLNPKPAFSFEAENSPWQVYVEPFKVDGLLQATSKISGGLYTWHIVTQEGFLLAVIPDVSLTTSDFYMAADFWVLKGPQDAEYGFVFDWTDADNFRYLGFNQEGEYFYKIKFGGEIKTHQSSQLDEWLFNLMHPLNRFSPKKANHLAARYQDSVLSLYLNHYLLGTFDALEPGEGKLGLGLGLSSAESVDFQISNFEVCTP